MIYRMYLKLNRDDRWSEADCLSAGPNQTAPEPGSLACRPASNKVGTLWRLPESSLPAETVRLRLGPGSTSAGRTGNRTALVNRRSGKRDLRAREERRVEQGSAFPYDFDDLHTSIRNLSNARTGSKSLYRMSWHSRILSESL